MKAKPCQCLVGLVLTAASALASPVASEPLKAFDYRPQPTPAAAPFLTAPRPAAPDFKNRALVDSGPQLSDREMRDLRDHLRAPVNLTPHGLYTRDLPGGAQVTAAGPFAPGIPGDPHVDIARFTLVGLNW